MPFESSFIIHLKLIKNLFILMSMWTLCNILNATYLMSWNTKVGTILHSLMNFWCPKLPSWNIPKFHMYWKNTLWNKNPYPWFYILCVCVCVWERERDVTCKVQRNKQIYRNKERRANKEMIGMGKDMGIRYARS